jgi:hypothetical protein
MKQDLRDRAAMDVKRVSKPWKCPRSMRHHVSDWKPPGIKVPKGRKSHERGLERAS